MKIAKIVALAAFAAATTTCAFADAADVMVYFNTGAGTYADGTKVVENEWYALCWSSDGIFEGINPDCTPYDSNDKMFLLAQLPLNEDVMFELSSSKAPSEGRFTVLVLDTRDASGKPAAKVNKKPAYVKMAIAENNYPVTDVLSPTSANSAWSVTSVDTSDPNFKPAKIAAIDVSDANVYLTVSDMLPGVQYNIMTGSEPNSVKTYSVGRPKTAGAETTFILDKDDAKFFKVVREPLTK